MRITGDLLNEKFDLNAMDARYRRNGVWYHPLRAFPGVLFDGGGYVLFESKKEYLNSKFIKHGPDPNHIHVRNGISSIPGYKSLKPPPSELEKL